MSEMLKAALVTWLCKGGGEIIRVEEPKDGTAWMVVFSMDNKVGSRFNNYGTGATQERALLDAIGRSGAAGLKFKLWLLEWMVEHLAVRVAPAALRRIENGAA